jgi:uncharacterized damage-inducible protein DinB
MQRRSHEASMREALLETYAVNEAMNQFILEHLDPKAWRANPPGRRARTIAAIFAHVHNIRRKWLRLSAPHLDLPAQLDRIRCTQRQARAALTESAKRCLQMLAEALLGPEGHAKQFRRDGWARPWPAGAPMVAYMLSHEAHHRGQVCMLAHQLGFPIAAGYKIWAWERLRADKVGVRDDLRRHEVRLRAEHGEPLVSAKAGQEAAVGGPRGDQKSRPGERKRAGGK